MDTRGTKAELLIRLQNYFAKSCNSDHTCNDYDPGSSISVQSSTYICPICTEEVVDEDANKDSHDSIYCDGQ